MALLFPHSPVCLWPEFSWQLFFICMWKAQRSNFNFASKGINFIFKYNFKRDSQQMEFSLNPKGYQILQISSNKKGITWDGDTERICWKLTGSPPCGIWGWEGREMGFNLWEANGRISKCNILFVHVSLCSPNLSLWILYCFLSHSLGRYNWGIFGTSICWEETNHL